jgi:hypothetical protein
MSDKILITSAVAVWATRRQVYSAQKSHNRFKDIVAALKNGDTGLAYRLYSSKEEKTRIQVKGNELYFDEQKFDPIFAEAYQIAKEHGLPFDKLELFFENLSQNPSPISVMAFTGFLAKSKMPITDRGTFLAYKKIRHDYLDCHSSSFDNRPGCVVWMERSKVDSIQTNECSTGFHVCSHEYLNSFGGDVTVVCEINPKDVVAVPPDYRMTKMRVASYRVLCTLPYFKEKLLSYEADALGRIPIFNTECMVEWDVIADVPSIDRPHLSLSADDWLASRKEAK